MQKIKVLSRETADQIAAGEVIQSPSCAVKELVDNSLDAASSRIVVEVKGGGFQLIRVVDDGFGMTADDANQCFIRHATSKIESIADLEKLDSMGFRGEALASIASIARVDLLTAIEGSSATHLKIESGCLISVSSGVRSKGTTVEVRSLFYNVPARKKFQRGASASSADIHKLMVAFGLAYPNKSLCLVSNEEVVLDLSEGGEGGFLERLRHRAINLLKGEAFPNSLSFEAEENGYQLQALLGAPHEHRINRTGQYVFINKRPVRSLEISQAVRDGFGHRLDEGRHPLFVLHLTVPPHLIDVNIHPQKREVRFHEKPFLEKWIKSRVQAALGFPLPSVGGYFEGLENGAIPFNPSTTFEASTFQEDPFASSRSPQVVDELTDTEKVIGVFRRYLLLDGSSLFSLQGNGIAFVDLRRVQETLIEEAWRDSSGTTLGSQGLLFPITVELDSIEIAALEQRQNFIKEKGFSFQIVGKRVVRVEAIPAFLEEVDAIDGLKMMAQSDLSHSPRQFISFALRKRDCFSVEEGVFLWRQVRKKRLLNDIPILSIDDIKKLFR